MRDKNELNKTTSNTLFSLILVIVFSLAIVFFIFFLVFDNFYSKFAFFLLLSLLVGLSISYFNFKFRQELQMYEKKQRPIRVASLYFALLMLIVLLVYSTVVFRIKIEQKSEEKIIVLNSNIKNMKASLLSLHNKINNLTGAIGFPKSKKTLKLPDPKIKELEE